MRRQRMIAVIPILPFWIFSSIRQETVRVQSESVRVVASRIPGTLDGLSRSVTVVTREEIGRMSVRSAADVLRYSLGMDIQERGAKGAQADLSIRGSTFQQVLVLVDGVRFGDLQTGHHNMDLPLAVESIERVEIMRGPGSSLYGPDAFGGVVNIVTKAASKGRFAGDLGFSDFRTSAASLAWEAASKRASNVLSFDRNASGGFMKDRDFHLWQISDKLTVKAGRGRIAMFAGHGQKEFGALDFYTPGLGLPSREWTRTTFVALGYEAPVMGMSLSQHVYYRTHFDRFLIDRSRPSYYTNETTNTSLGTDVVLRKGNLAFGGEAERGGVRSSKIGDHSDVRAALFAEYRSGLGRKIVVNIGLRQDYHTTYGFSLSPSAAVVWMIGRGFSWKASAGHSFRAPSYTELYYRDPANAGDPDLKPERAWSGETGWDLRVGRRIALGLTFFHRNEKDLIDWVRKTDGLWRAVNIRRLKMAGAELEVSASFGPLRLGLQHSLMAASEESPYLSYKYGFRYPRSQGGITLDVGSLAGLTFQMRLNHKKRLHQRAYAVLDAGASAKVWKKLNIYLQASNLFNATYEDVPGVRQPGRWVGSGIRFDF